MDNLTCGLCFDEVNGNDGGTENMDRVRCIACNSIICMDCMLRYVDLSDGLPKCINTQCFKDLHKTDLEESEILIPFCKKLYKMLVSMPSVVDAIASTSDKKRLKMLIEKIVSEKQKYIKKEYPKAVDLVINIAFSKKLKTINKENMKILKTMKARRKCFSLACIKGFLMTTERCLACDTCFQEFCLDCEQLVKGEHACNQSDLDNVKYVKKLVKCPKCLYPVEKISGCNNITCPACKTNFDYTTGLESKAGNHDKTSFDAKSAKAKSLVDLYAVTCPYTQNLLQILDNRVPNKLNLTNIVKCLDAITIALQSQSDSEESTLNESNLDILYVKLFNAYYADYVNFIDAYKKYYECLANIQIEYEKGNLNLESVLQHSSYLLDHM